MLYPHYFCEWIEWLGFWIAAGFSSVPAMMFVVNEVAAMLPRAVKGKRWYAEKFGEEKIRNKWAVIPGVLGGGREERESWRKIGSRTAACVERRGSTLVDAAVTRTL
ncbi:hypothetical protein VTK73DRAFT_5783 [Phialemonium thermophilum]|uniref:3-oxo-5-alpha-steroid 4-dehydrogenase C-terminal domain-containing protein n=1 Tax=Phialemonium thermophilum TaxID=223376 RepID=A0ABR3V0N5_9PEZI